MKAPPYKTGPAFGPLPYIAPNLFLIIPLIVAGIVMLIIGIVLRKSKLIQTDIVEDGQWNQPFAVTIK
jgi:hypothetical protein